MLTSVFKRHVEGQGLDFIKELEGRTNKSCSMMKYTIMSLSSLNPTVPYDFTLNFLT